jgi:hypothetical protein
MGLTPSKETPAGFTNSVDDMFVASRELHSTDSIVGNSDYTNNLVNECNRDVTPTTQDNSE